MIRAIIFDWGRTLHDPEGRRIYPDAIETIPQLAERYRLAICTIVGTSTESVRVLKVRTSPIGRFFRSVRSTTVAQVKDLLFEKTLDDLGLVPAEVVVVDDRVKRGVAWANRVGATSVWLHRPGGKFSDELPTAETGQPTYIITALDELPGVLHQERSGVDSAQITSYTAQREVA
ncbi:HAD hydrolase-like protein [Candidatus Berkelbacteria bacterium]|nr:HAD hydrolase-like protein [Candidatus Berkelbacteria bacterium]